MAGPVCCPRHYLYYCPAGNTIVVWFCLDYLCDLLYVIDILFHFRTGYLEDGVLQTDAAKLRNHYMNSTTFYIDCLCLLPLDFLYLSIGFNSILRSFRIVKIYRFWAFMDRTERHTNYPNLIRSGSLIHYLLVIFHWNGCLYHIIYKNNGFGSKNWVYTDAGTEETDTVKRYLQSYYWCTLALTTIGDLPKPRSNGEYAFVICQLLFGLLLFATVLGHVASIVVSVSAGRKEFQGESLPGPLFVVLTHHVNITILSTYRYCCCNMTRVQGRAKEVIFYRDSDHPWIDDSLIFWSTFVFSKFIGNYSVFIVAYLVAMID